MSRPLLGFVAVIVIGALLWGYGFRLGAGLAYWVAVLIVALVAGLGLRSSQRRLDAPIGDGEFLCDTCKLNHERYCGRPERPNATRCDEYQSRG
jgi:uncharacterized membrane protein YraQ (UPF0718 family)